MKPIRMGTLGAARITPPALLTPARRSPDVEVVAVAARDRDRAQAFADKHGIPRVADSYDDLIADPDIDAVYVPLPNSHHGVWTMRAIEAGKHVLCEKPFTADADEARTVAAAAAARPDLVVMEAFHWRYHPVAERIRDIVSSGELGDVLRVDTSMCIPFLLLDDIRWNLDLAGGAMMDVGCYAVSMLRHLSGTEPRVVSARAWERSPGVDRRIDATFDLGEGRTGSIKASMLSTRVLDVRATIVGTSGRLDVLNPVAPQIASVLSVRTPPGRRLEVPTRSVSTYGAQLAAFVAAIQDGAPIWTPPSDAIANMTVIDDVYRAAGMSPRRPTSES